VGRRLVVASRLILGRSQQVRARRDTIVGYVVHVGAVDVFVELFWERRPSRACAMCCPTVSSSHTCSIEAFDEAGFACVCLT
jgi:hypothetical protein